jgi:fucose 4-O-acetylase-like acetyltransferase
MNSKSHQLRHDYIDYLKGLLILLVVYGHTIQYIAYPQSGDFYDNPLFKGIYIFHMPLFIAVSGFLSFYSIRKKTASESIQNRFYQLVIPIFCWTLLFNTILFSINLYHVKSGKLELILDFPKLFLYEFSESLWFLWSVFIATIIVAILRKFNKDKALFFVVASCCMFLAPDLGNLYLIKFTFPFFCAGYLLSKHYQVYRQIKISYPQIFLGVLISLICFLLWRKDTYIYTSKMNFLDGNYKNIALRYFSGGVVSVTFVMASFSLLYRNFKSSFVCALGKNSLSIYILQSYIFIIIQKTGLMLKVNNFMIITLLPLVTVLICVSTHYLAGILCHYSFPRQWLLGGWTRRESGAEVRPG